MATHGIDPLCKSCPLAQAMEGLMKTPFEQLGGLGSVVRGGERTRSRPIRTDGRERTAPSALTRGTYVLGSEARGFGTDGLARRLRRRRTPGCHRRLRMGICQRAGCAIARSRCAHAGRTPPAGRARRRARTTGAVGPIPQRHRARRPRADQARACRRRWLPARARAQRDAAWRRCAGHAQRSRVPAASQDARHIQWRRLDRCSIRPSRRTSWRAGK